VGLGEGLPPIYFSGEILTTAGVRGGYQAIGYYNFT
jgi:hypothetical protein